MDALVVTPVAAAAIAAMNAGSSRRIEPVTDTQGRTVIGADVLSCIGPGEYLEAFAHLVRDLPRTTAEIPRTEEIPT